MVTTDEEGEIGCFASPAIVFVEVTYGSELLRHGHGVEVVGVANCLSLSACVGTFNESGANLEVPSDDEKVNAIPSIDFAGLLD